MKATIKTNVLIAMMFCISNVKAIAKPFYGNDTMDIKNSNGPLVKEEFYAKDGIQTRVYSDNKGNVTRMRRDYMEKDLNPFIKSRFKKQFPGKIIFGITEFTTENGVSYIIIAYNNKHWYHINSNDLGEMSLAKIYDRDTSH